MMSVSDYHTPPSAVFENLINKLHALLQQMEQQVIAGHDIISGLPGNRRHSAENLMRYLLLRSYDLRPVQLQLARLGLSSLGHVEPDVLATIKAVLCNLYLLAGRQPPLEVSAGFDFERGQKLDVLQQNTQELLGDQPEKHKKHIMVTMSSEAADDYLLVHQLVLNGMDCLRINCSHDEQTTWSRTIQHLRDAECATGRSCRILMDLGGPKLRIGPMKLQASVLKIRPRRNSHGQVLCAARIWLYAQEEYSEMDAADAAFLVDPGWMEQLLMGDRIRLTDVRGARRNWRVREVSSDGCWAESKKTSYVANGTVLKLRPDASGDKRTSVIRNLPPLESSIVLRVGDVLIISGKEKPGKASILDDVGGLLSPGKISLPVAEIYRDAHPGEHVCFDDGRIVGIIEKVKKLQLQIRITHTRKPVEKLSRDKGINFPNTELGLPALGEKDLVDLAFAAHNADMIGLSFANSPDDVRSLRAQLLELGCDDVAVVLKIETRRGFNNLPAMLLEAMKFPACGVMIARGDLGVELGFERMAEVQEEIMWLCEAAHVPVIWATQVLEGLAKSGHASRAEVTDAARSQAAECVMLNKGPYIVEAVKVLDDILQRMQSHQHKKLPLLRKLRVAATWTSE